ncbi:DUF3054 domain-containing protein [Microbacterium sulfonylureivorans]|uniref:DUF3054 domain-containing protein n=1 Tax=Microbacterium sulfonylureivorans TaxID=2486854 RepID=UPI000FD827AD|nr:DUF3054 domain-containing protein [Microbacterium sulfonylureivorans]
MSGPSSASPVSSRAVAGAFALDVVLVVVFAAIGRASHGEDALAGLWITAWPFLAGLVAGWLITQGWNAPTAPARTGLGIWAITVAGGMLLRAASGQGIAVAFVIVAAITLLLFLVGWRVIARLVSRARVAKSSPR